MIPAIDPCGYLWANQGTKKHIFYYGPQCTLHNQFGFYFLLVMLFWKIFFQPITCMKPIFWKKTFFEIKKHICLNTKNMVFKKINTIFLEKQQGFFFIFGLLPWKFIESLLQTFSQTFRGGCKFDWNFQCKLAGMGWKFHCKLSRLDCKFKRNLQGYTESFFKLAIQPWKFAVKLSNPSLQVCIESFSQTCNPPWKFDWKFATNFQ